MIDRNRILTAALALALGVPLALAGLVAVRSWRGAAFEFHPPRPRQVVWPAGTADVPGREEVRFTSLEGDPIRGWFVPSRNGAALALVHGTVADRRQFVPEIVALTAHGYGILAYDEPGCGESGGRVSWGHSERAALRAALDLLQARGIRRLGVLGFSQGSFIAAQVAANDPRVQALVLEGAVANFREQTMSEFPRWGPLSEWPAYLGRIWSGYRPSDPQPEQVIGNFHHPLLIIGGSEDHHVSAAQSERLIARAPGPREYWSVPGAAHGGYGIAAPEEYPRRLLGFLDGALRK